MKAGERQVAPTLDGIRRDHVARYEWAAAKLPASSSVVDVACGVGYGSAILADAGHSVLGIDRDGQAIAYAIEHYHRPGRVTYRAKDVGEAELTASTAVCFELIEHLADPLPALRKLRESAKLLLASVPNEDVFPWSGHAFHHRHYTRQEFESLLNAAGWWVKEWLGQRGPESEVEPMVEGRTLIAVCEPGKAITAEPVLRKAEKVPDHVAIIGLGPSSAQYLRIARGAGSRGKFCDEVWAINALGDILRCDRVFHMDDVRIQQIRADAAPDSNIAAMLAWLKTHPGPIYTSRLHEDYPGLVEFPLEDVINHLGYGYLNNTAAYAVAYAVHIGVKRISLFGIDFTYPNAHDAEKGRGCVEFWLGQAAARGIAIQIPHTSSLMDGIVPKDEKLYGYDTVRVAISTDSSGAARVRFTPRDEMPTAEEMEERYDHSKHPNPQISER